MFGRGGEVLQGVQPVIVSEKCYNDRPPQLAVWRLHNSGATRPGPDVPRMDTRILMAMSAFLSLVSVAALWGIWLGA